MNIENFLIFNQLKIKKLLSDSQKCWQWFHQHPLKHMFKIGKGQQREDFQNWSTWHELTQIDNVPSGSLFYYVVTNNFAETYLVVSIESLKHFLDGTRPAQELERDD